VLQAAANAFRGLAYKRFHHVPLYVEYAPADIFDSLAKAREKVAVKPTTVEHSVPEPSLDTTDVLEITSVYIKNLSFTTSQGVLEKKLGQAAAKAGGRLRSVKIPLKSGKNGQMLAQGFAFADFSSEQTARAAVTILNGCTVDGHKLELQLSEKKTATQTKVPRQCKNF
jgi:multiple RNA-binding domain-containing protein 1